MRGFALALLLALALPAHASSERFWEDITRRYVDVDGTVDYAGIERLARIRLRLFIRGLDHTNPEELQLPDRLAFWINAHNAAVVHAIVEGETPTELERRARLFHWFPIRVGGRTNTLDDLVTAARGAAHGDPRVYFALAFATRSSPDLAPTPYTGADLDDELEQATRRFINDPRHVRIGHAARVLQISPIFRWHRPDFEAEAGSLAAFIQPRLDQAPSSLEGWRIEFMPADWRM